MSTYVVTLDINGPPACALQDEEPILGWEGAIMSVFSREAADWEGSGYGPLLATPSVRPSSYHRPTGVTSIPPGSLHFGAVVYLIKLQGTSFTFSWYPRRAT